jgi:segregation and condensation protein B
MENLEAVIESLLFVADAPLTVESIRKIFPDVSSQSIRNALQCLMAFHESRQSGFHLREVAGGYQFRTRPEHQQWVRKFLQPNSTRLSRAALETLAVIAYKQPIIRSDVEHIRGVDCGGVIRALLERKLLRVIGRKEIPGRPLIYATTRQFLELFDLKSLSDLPLPGEIGKQEAHPFDALPVEKALSDPEVE